MKFYEALTNVTLGSGQVKLDFDQQQSRVRNINPADNRTLMINKTETEGVFEISGSVSFKSGEKFGWTGNTSRMGGMVRRIDEGTEESIIDSVVINSPEEIKQTVIAAIDEIPLVVQEKTTEQQKSTKPQFGKNQGGKRK